MSGTKAVYMPVEDPSGDGVLVLTHEQLAEQARRAGPHCGFGTCPHCLKNLPLFAHTAAVLCRHCRYLIFTGWKG